MRIILLLKCFCGIHTSYKTLTMTLVTSDLTISFNFIQIPLAKSITLPAFENHSVLSLHQSEFLVFQFQPSVRRIGHELFVSLKSRILILEIFRYIEFLNVISMVFFLPQFFVLPQGNHVTLRLSKHHYIT